MKIRQSKKTQILSNILSNESGNAMIETLPLIIILVVLLSFGLGFFGVVHTAILNSIGSRTYAFETFRNRSDTGHFRDRGDIGNASSFTHHYTAGNRFHSIGSEKVQVDGQFATSRKIAFVGNTSTNDSDPTDHNINIYQITGRNRKENGVAVSPAWIMVGYGLCIDLRCGD